MPYVWVEPDHAAQDHWQPWPHPCDWMAPQHGHCLCFEESYRRLWHVIFYCQDRTPRCYRHDPVNNDERFYPLERIKRVRVQRYAYVPTDGKPWYRCDFHGGCYCARDEFLRLQEEARGWFHRWLRAGKPRELLGPAMGVPQGWRPPVAVVLLRIPRKRSG